MIEKGEKWGALPGENIACKDCKHKRPGMMVNGRPAYTGGVCEKYRHKPKEVLFEGALCPRHEKE